MKQTQHVVRPCLQCCTWTTETWIDIRDVLHSENSHNFRWPRSRSPVLAESSLPFRRKRTEAWLSPSKSFGVVTHEILELSFTTESRETRKRLRHVTLGCGLEKIIDTEDKTITVLPISTTFLQVHHVGRAMSFRLFLTRAIFSQEGEVRQRLRIFGMQNIAKSETRH